MTATPAPTPVPTPTSAPEHDPTAERLLLAALRLIGDQGYHGATTRAIAAEAGVSEVTLFRRFRTKSDLTAAALSHVTEQFRSAGARPSDDVHADLVRLGEAYQRFVDRWPGLVARLLAEAAVQSDIGVVVARLITDNASAIEGIIVHHQRAGRLVDAPPDTLVSAFLGPILLGATVGRFLPGTGSDRASPVDLEAHSTRFLAGYRG